MIPLIAAEELEANPAFARLWEYVTKEVLAGDGSSRKGERERELRWRADRRKRRRSGRRKEVDGLGEGGVGSSGMERGAVGGTVHGYEDRDPEEEEGSEKDDQDEDVAEDDVEGEGKKEKKPSLSFDEQLHALRVRRVKRRILRDVLDDVAYVDLSASKTRAQSEGRHDGNQSYRSHGAEKHSRRQIPIASSAISSRAGETEIADVTNKDSDLYGETMTMKKLKISDQMDGGVAERSPGTYLPQSLGELVRVIAAYLHVSIDGPGDLSSSLTERNSWRRGIRKQKDGVDGDGEREEGLLHEDIQQFRANIAPIANAVSSRLIELESSLCALSNIAIESDDGKEDEHGARARGTRGRMSVSHSLHESIQTQLSHLFDLRDTLLPSSLTTLTSTLQDLLNVQRQLLQLQIQHLETSKHGVLSRYTMSKIGFLDTVAQAMALKTQVLVLEARKDFEFSPEAEKRREAIREKMAEVGKEEDEMDERIRLLEGMVAEYEAVDPGAGIMGKLGSRYKEIEEEMEGVKTDIEKLQRQGVEY